MKTMENNREMKMQLLKEFGITDDKKSVDFCREAYKFLTEGEDVKKLNPSCDIISDADTEPQAVDLGLPSGTLWCDRNVGAKSPYDDGAYFSWGNTEPHYPKQDDNDWGDNDEAFEGTCFDEDSYQETAGAKLEGNIDLAHDAANVNMGEQWQMPTKEQFEELAEHCIWQRKTINGVNGYKVTSKTNGNSIFFACSGYGNGTSRNFRGSDGYYWSSTFISSRNARRLYFYSGGVIPQSSNYRYNGFPVRPVQNLSRR